MPLAYTRKARTPVSLLTKSWSKLVKIGRHWSKYVFGQGDSDDQYPKGPPLVT